MTTELTKLREALRRVKYEAVSLADAQVIALEALTAAQPAQTGEVQQRLFQLLNGAAGDGLIINDIDAAELFTDLFPEHIEFITRGGVGPTQPAAQATPEPLSLGPLAKRNIYDAIRGAYDLGYNDARNARTVPGDSAPGYDGRSVEEDHGGALFNLLSKRLTPAMPEPVGEPDAWLRQAKQGPGVHDPLVILGAARPTGYVAAYRPVAYCDAHPAPGVPEGWRDAKNDPPPVGLDVLVAVEFDRPGDWRIKVGGRNPQERTGWCVFGASWVPQVWMPLDAHRATLAAAQAKGGEHA